MCFQDNEKNEKGIQYTNILFGHIVLITFTSSRLKIYFLRDSLLNKTFNYNIK